MRQKIILIRLFIILFGVSFGPLLRAKEITILPYKKNIQEKIFKGQIFSESKVETTKVNKLNQTISGQSLNFSIAGLHPKSCQYALKKLSLYESYDHFLDFVKESKYDEKKEEINFLLSHLLLPFKMRLIFILPRIKQEGIYDFKFSDGFLSGLTGKINVSTHNSRCLFYTTAAWSGADTKIPNKILELFSQALSGHAMSRLFQISSTLGH